MQKTLTLSHLPFIQMIQTQVELAYRGILTHQVINVAKAENISPDLLMERVARGSVAIMTRGGVSVGIGEGLRTKVNVNLGTSSVICNPSEEVKKAIIAGKHGADTISELSMGGDITRIRKEIFKNTMLPITTVPIYQACAEQGLKKVTWDHILDTVRIQAGEGVSSFVFHCVSKEMLKLLKSNMRILGVVSKGGSITCAYMHLNQVENPFIENFDELLATMKRYDIVLSLGNTMRSGCIHDTRDKVQIAEMKKNAELASRAHLSGVQVIIEGMGGHVRADRIARNVKFQKKQTPFPLFVAGPLPTDVAMGYDHIAGCVGASIASGAGADYLCYITPAEHLGLPNPEHVREGLIAFRIAAHIGDSIKYGLSDEDSELAVKRAELDFEGQLCHALDPARASEIAPRSGPCTMCGEFCAIKIMKDYHS
jgi:phosphomethylpyrimidine synthase